jgi:2-oxoglutarate ferredoxin oxidoreductase subunit gamma
MGRLELTIAGVGGQGSILAGVVLGSAAVTYDGKYATQTQAYSSELRGGFAATWVVISDEPVVFPRVLRPDILVAQAQDSIQRFKETLKSDGILIFDRDMVSSPGAKIGNMYQVPATTIARNALGAPVTANMVMLGALCRITRVVSRRALEMAISAAVPKGKETINLDAFRMGFEKVKPI